MKMDDLIFEFIFEFVFESVFGSFIDGFVGALSAVILPLAVILLLFYFYHAFTWRQIGQKAGLEEDWMPFIPIARSLYRLKIVGDRPWKLFFFMDSTVSWLVLILGLCLCISVGFLFIFILFGILYLVFMFVVTIQYRIKYYRVFDMNPLLVLPSLIVGLNMITMTIDAILAYTKLFDSKGFNQNAEEQNTGRGTEQGCVTGISGEYKGTSLPIEDGQELILGKDPAVCNVVLTEHLDFISHKHCSIRYMAASNTYTLMDYSKNGVFDEQGNPLHSNMQLYPGSVIMLANQDNMFRLG